MTKQFPFHTKIYMTWAVILFFFWYFLCKEFILNSLVTFWFFLNTEHMDQCCTLRLLSRNDHIWNQLSPWLWPKLLWLITDLRWVAPRSPCPGDQCRRLGPFYQSRSRAGCHPARSRGNERRSARPGGCRVWNWPAHPRRTHPTGGPGCHGCCWLDCGCLVGVRK